jgi:hypothetical protein
VLRVYVRGESSGDDVSEAEDAAYELLGHAVDALRPSGRDSVEAATYLAGGGSADRAPLEN